MSRLIVVSNRVAPVDEGRPTSGGLAVAMLAALKRSGGVWFGWSGEVVAAPQSEPKLFKTGRLTYATVDLSARDYEEYYSGFANRVLWPLFHYRLDLTQFSRREYAGYLRVNSLFAATLVSMLQPTDRIWVHDYHLIPMGEALRRAGFEGAIGFFLHTPLPPAEVLEALPSHHDLMRALCAYDVVGFQTRRDVQGFHDYMQRVAGGELLSDNRVRAYGRTLTVRDFPIGLDVDNVVRMAEVAEHSRQSERLRDSLGGRSLILGVDRLDYSKGLVQRFFAFERLLENYPANRNRATLLQVAPPSRMDVPEYANIRRELQEASGRINGQFAEFDWVPIRYLNRGITRRTLTGFYRVAKIGLVTPLRDGMNLVAKEYVAAQRADDPGVLVLSRFAGAAQELEQALLVNPYDVDEVAEALQIGIEMPRAERQERWQGMMQTIRENDIDAWRDRFVDTLDNVRCVV